MLDTVAAQAAAIDELIDLAQHRLQIFDVDLSQCGWQTAARAERLVAFLRRAPSSKIDLIVHDTRRLETSCPRLLALLRMHTPAFTVYRTGSEAKSAMDPLLIADGRHFLHRFHFDQPRASLAIEQPQLARPLVTRFEQIWATGEPGLGATVLGL
ncbi:MAG: hypothetical protein IT521_04540 [Burkholderiales bacterium]|nr:hypothetical protein [Burkholderiales bacterium]